MKLWRIVLAIFLLVWAIIAITSVRFQFQEFLLGLLAGAAGILLLMDR